MTVTATPPRVAYTGTGAVATYAFTFRLFQASDLVVQVEDLGGTISTLVLGVDYSLTGLNSYTGGSITLLAGNLTAGYVLTMLRDPGQAQASSFRNQGAFLAGTVEDALDLLTMQLQAARDLVGRSLQAPGADNAPPVILPALNLRKGTILAFDPVTGAPIAATSIAGAPATTFGASLIAAADEVAARIVLGGVTKTVATIAALKAVAGTGLSGSAFVLGYYAAGDGGGGLFRYNSGDVSADNGGTVIAPAVGAGRWNRIFDGAVDARWFGAVGDDVADDTTALSNWLTATMAVITGARVGAVAYLPSGTYKVTAALPTITKDRLRIIGDGIYATKIHLAPTATCTLLAIHNGAAEIFQNRIESLAIFSTDTTYVKTALDIVDTSDFTMRDVLITGINDVSFGSIGLRLRGRELTLIENVTLFADLPLSIEDNPNHTIDCDHLRAQHLYLSANHQPCIKVASGVNLSNVTFDGGAWTLGTHGFYWLDAATAQVGYCLAFKNIRREQTTDATAYNIYIAHNYGLQDVLVEQFHCDPGQKGMYGRNIDRLSLRHFSFGNPSAGEGLNLDGCQLTGEQCFFEQNTTVSLANMQPKLEWNKKFALSPMYQNFMYGPSAAATPQTDQPLRMFGTKVWQWTGQLANNGSVAIPTADAQGRTVAHVSVAGYSAVGPIVEGGQVIDAAGGTALAGATTNFVITNTGGKLIYLRQAASDTLLLNKTGQTLDVVIFAVYK